MSFPRRRCISNFNEPAALAADQQESFSPDGVELIATSIRLQHSLQIRGIRDRQDARHPGTSICRSAPGQRVFTVLCFSTSMRLQYSLQISDTPRQTMCLGRDTSMRLQYSLQISQVLQVAVVLVMATSMRLQYSLQIRLATVRLSNPWRQNFNEAAVFAADQRPALKTGLPQQFAAGSASARPWEQMSYTARQPIRGPREKPC